MHIRTLLCHAAKSFFLHIDREHVWMMQWKSMYDQGSRAATAVVREFGDIVTVVTFPNVVVDMHGAGFVYIINMR